MQYYKLIEKHIDRAGPRAKKMLMAHENLLFLFLFFINEQNLLVPNKNNQLTAQLNRYFTYLLNIHK